MILTRHDLKKQAAALRLFLDADELRPVLETGLPERIRSERLPSTRGQAIRPPPVLHSEEAIRELDRTVMREDRPVVLDLFCGAGGLSLGFRDAGFVVAAGIDLDAYAVATYAANFAARARVADLAAVGKTRDSIRAYVRDELRLPRVHVVVGGPPCQGFAGVGRAKIRSLEPQFQQRLAPRNDLYREFVHFVETLEPLCFVMENVPHLASFQEGRVAARIREDFDRIGYDIGTDDRPGEPLFLDAEDYGVPQTRRRMFFVGTRRGVTAPIPGPRATHNGALVQPRNRASLRSRAIQLGLLEGRDDLAMFYLPPPRTLADAIADLPAIPPGSANHIARYRPKPARRLFRRGVIRDWEYRDLMRAGLEENERGRLYDHVVRPVREDDTAAFRHMPEGGTYLDVPEKYRRYDWEKAHLSRGHFEDRYFRLPWGEPARAITAHIAKDGYWYIHPDRRQGRTLSVREAARIQSFPDHFRFAGYRTSMYRQIGNAVPPLLAYAIALSVLEAIERRASPVWRPALIGLDELGRLTGRSEGSEWTAAST